MGRRQQVFSTFTPLPMQSVQARSGQMLWLWLSHALWSCGNEVCKIQGCIRIGDAGDTALMAQEPHCGVTARGGHRNAKTTSVHSLLILGVCWLHSSHHLQPCCLLSVCAVKKDLSIPLFMSVAGWDNFYMTEWRVLSLLRLRYRTQLQVHQTELIGSAIRSPASYANQKEVCPLPPCRLMPDPPRAAIQYAFSAPKPTIHCAAHQITLIGGHYKLSGHNAVH